MIERIGKNLLTKQSESDSRLYIIINHLMMVDYFLKVKFVCVVLEMDIDAHFVYVYFKCIFISETIY